MKIHKMMLCLIALGASFPSMARVENAPQAGENVTVDRALVVGTKEAVPFAIKGSDGRWSGISIDLLDGVMHELGWSYELVEVPLDDLLEDVQSRKLDLAISAITITSEREIGLDFGHGYYASGLGIAVSAEGGGWKGFTRRLFSARLMSVVGFTILLLIAVGFLSWLAERRMNPEQFGGGIVRGVGEGFWFSAVTMTTVGYGDKAPVTRAGRALALVWMFASLVAISSLTAAITSALTLNELETGISGPSDLPSVKVGSVMASTSQSYLEDRAIRPHRYASAEDALQGLMAGEVEAVVYDAPILQYRINENFRGELMTLGDLFEHQNYGVAFSSGSELREPFNRAMLRFLDGPGWQRILSRYLGE